MNEHENKIVRDALSVARREHFADGFADRVVARWHADRSAELSIGAIVAVQFRKFVPYAIAAAAVLAVYNVRHQARSSGQTVVEAMVGVQPVTVESLYGLDALLLSR